MEDHGPSFSEILTNLQASELSRRIRDAEKDVKRLVEDETSCSVDHQRHATTTDESAQRPDPEAQQREPYEEDGGSDDDDETNEELTDDESYDALENRFHGLEEEVANLVADVHDLALYTKLNITGFMKILKVRYIYLQSCVYVSNRGFRNMMCVFSLGLEQGLVTHAMHS